MAGTAADTGPRERILAATVEVIAEDGIAGLTHRAVAARADVSLAATTYYFASKDELLREALRGLAAEEAQQLRAAEQALSPQERADARAVAARIAHVLANQSRVGAKYELYLAAAREPEVRRDALSWIAAFTDLAGAVVPGPWAARALVAAVDGLVLHHLATAGAVDEHGLARDVERLLVALRRS